MTRDRDVAARAVGVFLRHMIFLPSFLLFGPIAAVDDCKVQHKFGESRPTHNAYKVLDLSENKHVLSSIM